MSDLTILGVTKGGKEIIATTMPNRSVTKLYFRDGGELPKELSGAFSDRTAAMVAVGKYLADEPKPRKPRAKSRTKRAE